VSHCTSGSAVLPKKAARRVKPNGVRTILRRILRDRPAPPASHNSPRWHICSAHRFDRIVLALNGELKCEQRTRDTCKRSHTRVNAKVRAGRGFPERGPHPCVWPICTAGKARETGNGGQLAEQVKRPEIPPTSNSAVDPLFNGTLFLCSHQFTIKSQNNAVKSVSAADMATAVNYATQAARPISKYAAQYGPNTISVSTRRAAFFGNTARPRSTMTHSSKAGSLDSIPKQPAQHLLHCHSQSAGIDQYGWRSLARIGGYHGNANVPYCFVNLFRHEPYNRRREQRFMPWR